MQINKIQTNSQQYETTGFKGVGSAVLNGAGTFFKVCDDVPMFGVAFADTAATNVPRTVVDLKETGVPAAAETLRREFSGLFINCLIPGGFVYAAARVLNHNFMKDFTTTTGKPLNMSGSWANGETIQNLVGVWKSYSGLEKDIGEMAQDAKADALDAIKDKKFGNKGFIKSALNKVEGLNGVNSWDKLSDYKEIIDEAAEILNPVMGKEKSKNIIERFKFNRQKNQAIKNAYEAIVNGQYTYKNAQGQKITKVIENSKGGFKAAQNLKFDGKTIGSDLRNLLRDATDIGSALSLSKEARINPNKFIKKASNLVNTKSLLGLSVVIPLAMSMQYINRAITRHKYKKSGAPIYKDFENERRTLTEDEKKKLKLTKPLAVLSIFGLAALSMGKSFPKSIKSAVEMLQFNTKFPTLNQCRVIATCTFASRMMASEDPNELRESTVRDLASFAGLYFLGDYAEKLVATAIQKFSKPGHEGKLQIFNKTKNPSEYKNIAHKFVGWVKDTNIKSFDEIPKEYKNYRSLAKLGGLGFSIGLLGILLPKYNKHVTNKKEMKRKAMLEEQKMHHSKIKQIETLSNNPVFSNIASKFIK